MRNRVCFLQEVLFWRNDGSSHLPDCSYSFTRLNFVFSQTSTLQYQFYPPTWNNTGTKFSTATDNVLRFGKLKCTCIYLRLPFLDGLCLRYPVPVHSEVVSTFPSYTYFKTMSGKSSTTCTTSALFSCSGLFSIFCCSSP